MTNNQRTKTKNSDNNINKSYMPKITKARQLKILKFLNLKKSPYKSINGDKFKKEEAEFFQFNNKKLKEKDAKERKEKAKERQKARRNKYQTKVYFEVVRKYQDTNGNTQFEIFEVNVPVELTFKQTKNMTPVYNNTLSEYLAGHEYIEANPDGTEFRHDPFVVIRYQPKNKLMKTKMKNIICKREYLIDFKGGRDLVEIDKGNSECVIDYLVHTYNNPDKKSHRIKKLTRENIIKLLENNYMDIMKIQDEKEIDKKTKKMKNKPIEPFDIKKGITTEQILLINKHYIRRNVIGVNIDDTVFIKHQEPKLNMKVEKDIIFMVADNHFFPIEDKRIRKNLQIQTQIANSMRVKQEAPADREGDDTNVKNKIIRDKVIDPSISELLKLTNKNVYYTDREDLTPILIEIMRTTAVLPNEDLFTDSTGLKKIVWNSKNVCIYANKKYNDSVYNCKQLGFDFDNQNLTKIVNEFFKNNYTLPKSCFNKEVDNIFRSDHTRTVAFRDTFEDPKKSDNINCVDMNKQYVSALYFNKYDFCIFTPLDEVHEYDGNGYDRPGFYEIIPDKSNMYFPLTGVGFYNYGTLIEAAKLGLKFEVKKQIISSNTIPADFFKKFIDTIKEKCKSWKLMLNSFIGCLNKIQSETYKYLFTSDIDQASALHFQSDSSIHINSHEYITNDNNEETMYICNKKKIELFQETNRPIYNHILEQSHINLAKFCKKYDIKNEDIIQIKTDCVIFRSDKLIEYNNKLGGWKSEDLPSQYFIKSREPRTKLYEIENKEWKILDDVKNAINNDEGFLLTGLPGTGKTYNTKNIIKLLANLKKKVVLTATTNAATRLIPGAQTLHKVIGLDNDAELYTYNHLNKFKFVDYAIIDEYSMLDSNMYKILSMIKKKYDVKFIIVGDSNQLPAVEKIPRDYENSYILKYLTDTNRMTLTKNMRSDSIMWDIYHNILDGDEVKNKFKLTNKIVTDLHICLSNEKRHEINQMMMKKKVKNKHIILDKLDKVKDGKRIALYEMIIYKDLPVVCKINNKKLNVCNNERFIITGFNKKKKIISIKRQLPPVQNDNNEIIELSFLQFQTMFEVGYCITAHISQGATFTQPYTIHEYNHYHATKNWKLVTVSRTTDKSNIYISNK